MSRLFTRRFAFSVVTLCAVGLVIVSISRAPGQQFIGHGVMYESKWISNRSFRVIRVDLNRAEIKTEWKREDGSLLRTLHAAVENQSSKGKSVLFATNGGIFSPDRTPIGLLIQNGIELAPLNTALGTGNFFLQPNGVLFITPTGASIQATSDFQNKQIISAIQSGPMMLADGVVNSQFARDSNNRQIRSAVGVSRSGEVIFVLSHTPVTFYELASAFRDELECENALYLDGTISKFYVRKIDKLEDNEEFAGMIVIVER